MARLLFVIVVCVVFLSYLPVGCGTSGGGGAEKVGEQTPPQSTESIVASVRDLGPITVNPTILKRDVGFSGLYGGRSVWLFGDTTLDTPNDEDRTLLSNSWSSTFDVDAGDGIAGFTEFVDEVGSPVEFFPLTEEEKAYNAKGLNDTCGDGPCTGNWHMWPGTIIIDDDKGWAYVFYRKVLVESGIMNFQHVGHSFAVWKNYSEPAERPVFNYIESYPTLFFSEDGEPAFGSAAVVVDKNLYIYGCEQREDKLTKPCHVAQVPLARIFDKTAWVYYSGDGRWTSDVLASKEVFLGNDMMSVFFNAYINRYVAIYSEPLGATAMLRTASSPEGPWSEPTKLFTVDAAQNIHGWVYDFLAHPEYSQNNGKTIYLTYTNKLDHMHSELRLIEIELELSH